MQIWFGIDSTHHNGIGDIRIILTTHGAKIYGQISCYVSAFEVGLFCSNRAGIDAIHGADDSSMMANVSLFSFDGALTRHRHETSGTSEPLLGSQPLFNPKLFRALVPFVAGSLAKLFHFLPLKADVSVA